MAKATKPTNQPPSPQAFRPAHRDDGQTRTDKYYTNTGIRQEGGDDVVAILVDTQNMLGVALKAGFTRVDYRTIAERVALGRPWIGVACVARPASGTSLDNFCSYLEREGFSVAVWDSPMVAGERKVDLDPIMFREGAHLAYATRISELCVVAHDVDFREFEPICWFNKIRFTAAGLKGALSPHLRQRAHRIVELGDDVLHDPICVA